MLCKHQIKSEICIDCKLMSICEHNLKVKYCLECRNNLDCTHKEYRRDCHLCRAVYCELCDIVSGENYHKISTLHSKNFTRILFIT